VQRAFIYSFEETARTVFNNYLDNVDAFCLLRETVGMALGRALQANKEAEKTCDYSRCFLGSLSSTGGFVAADSAIL
jgi:hypothetical protein